MHWPSPSSSQTGSQSTGLNSLFTWLMPQVLELPGSPAPVPQHREVGGLGPALPLLPLLSKPLKFLPGSCLGQLHLLPEAPGFFPPTLLEASLSCLHKDSGTLADVSAPFTQQPSHTSPLTCSYTHIQMHNPTPAHACLYTYPLTVHVHTCLYTQSRKEGPPNPPLEG